MTDIDLWKIWAGTGLLLTLLATGTGARLRDSSTLTAGERRSEAVSQDPSLLAPRCSFLSAQPVDGTQGNGAEFDFSFGLRSYSQPLTAQAIISHQIIVPRAPIFEDATFPDDDILPDPAVQIASSFPIADPNNGFVAGADAHNYAEASDDVAVVNGLRLTNTVELDGLSTGLAWEVDSKAASELALYGDAGSNYQLNFTPSTLDGSLIDTVADIDGGFADVIDAAASLAYLNPVNPIDGPASNVDDLEALKALTARQVVIAAAVQQTQAGEELDLSLGDIQSNEGKLALLQIAQAQYEEMQAAQAQAALAQQAEAKAYVNLGRTVNELRGGLGTGAYYNYW